MIGFVILLVLIISSIIYFEKRESEASDRRRREKMEKWLEAELLKPRSRVNLTLKNGVTISTEWFTPYIDRHLGYPWEFKTSSREQVDMFIARFFGNGFVELQGEIVFPEQLDHIEIELENK